MHRKPYRPRLHPNIIREFIQQGQCFYISGPARGFGYTVSWTFLFQVYGIFCSKFGYKVFRFFLNFRYLVYDKEIYNPFDDHGYTDGLSVTADIIRSVSVGVTSMFGVACKNSVEFYVSSSADAGSLVLVNFQTGHSVNVCCPMASPWDLLKVRRKSCSCG